MGNALDWVLERIEALDTLKIAAKPETKEQTQTLAEAEVVVGHEAKEIKEKGSEKKKGVFDGWLFNGPEPKE